MARIKQYIDAIRNFASSRPWTTVFLILAVLGFGWWYYSSRNKQDIPNFAVISRGTVSQVVSVTGKVKPANEVNLSFEKSGRIAVVYHDVGGLVAAGTLLVSLESADVAAQLAQAKATVRSQEAKLEELRRGSRPEDIFVSEVDVENAANDVTNEIKNSYVNSDDAIRNKVDQLFSSPKSASPQFNFTISDSQLKNDIESGRVAVEAVLTSWNASTADLSATQDIYQNIKESKLALKKAGTVQEQIDAQAAEVDAANASVMNLQAQLAKTVIRSPISGVITRQDAHAGEIAGIGVNLVSVISAGKYEIEANIPEADIAKIKIGDKAQVTLDAYGNDALFTASVSKIDPAETVIDGVSTYRTTLQFKKSD